MEPITAIAGLTALSSLFGGGPMEVSSHSTLTKGQQEYLQNMINMNNQYAPQVQSGLFDMAQNPQNTYQNIGDFGEEIQNPYLRQRESMWDELESNVAGGGKFHSSSLSKQRAQFDEGTSMGLGQLRHRDRLMEMQGAESALGRSQNAYGMMQQGMYAPLNVQAIENVAMEGPGPMDGLINRGVDLFKKSSFGLF